MAFIKEKLTYENISYIKEICCELENYGICPADKNFSNQEYHQPFEWTIDRERNICFFSLKYDTLIGVWQYGDYDLKGPVPTFMLIIGNYKIFIEARRQSLISGNTGLYVIWIIKKIIIPNTVIYSIVKSLLREAFMKHFFMDAAGLVILDLIAPDNPIVVNNKFFKGNI